MSFQPSDTLRSQTFIGLIISQILAAFNDQAIHIVAIFYASDMLVRFVGLNQYYGWRWFDTPVVITLGTACFITPFFLFSALAGMLADRYSKRATLVFWKAAEVVMMGIALVGFLLPHTAAWGWADEKTLAIWSAGLVVLTVFLMGTHSAFFVPAKYGIMPEILQSTVLSRGNGILEATSFVAQILGTVTGGALYFWWQSGIETDGHLILGMEWVIGAILFGLALLGALASMLIEQVPAAAPDQPLTWKLWEPLGRNIGTLIRSRPLLLAVLGIAFFAFVTLYARQTLLYNGETHKDLDHAQSVLKVLKGEQNPSDGGTVPANLDEDAAAKNAELQVAYLIALVGLGVGLGSPLAGYLSGNKVELGLVPIGAISIVFSTLLLAFLIEPGWGEGLLSRLQVPQPELIAQPVSDYGKYVALVCLGISAGFYIVPLYTLLQHRAPKDSKGNLVATSNFVNVVGGLIAIGVYYAITLGLQAWFGLTLKRADVLGMSDTDPAKIATLDTYIGQLNAEVDFTTVLFLGASAMTLATLLVLCQQLPDFFVRTLMFLRKVLGHGMLARSTVQSLGISNLPSQGPVILATNCDRPEKCMLVLAATDRVIRFLILERSERLPILLRFLFKPVSLAVLKPKRITPEAINKALNKAVAILKRGEVVGLPAEIPGGIFDLDKFLHELRERLPTDVVPVYCGPDENGTDRNGSEKSKVWVVFDKPMAYEVPVSQICDKIHAIGDWIAKEEREGRTPAMPSGEKSRSSLGSILLRGEDLPGHP